MQPAAASSVASSSIEAPRVVRVRWADIMRFDRERYDERLGAWAMAWIVGSALGTIAHFALNGRVYYFNSYPIGVVDWLYLIASRGLFVVLSRSASAKAGWGLALLVSVFAAWTAPIQAVAAPSWWLEGFAVVLAGALVFGGLPAGPGLSSTVRIGAAVLVASSVARTVALRLYDESLSTTVLSVQ